MSTRDLLRKARPKIHKIDIDGSDGYIKALSGAGRAAYLKIVKDNDGSPSVAKIVALALCDESGALEYDVDSEKDIAELSETDGAVLDRIAMEIFRVSGLTKEASEEAGKN